LRAVKVVVCVSEGAFRFVGVISGQLALMSEVGSASKSPSSGLYRLGSAGTAARLKKS
jgi:hypothetical protein